MDLVFLYLQLSHVTRATTPCRGGGGLRHSEATLRALPVAKRNLTSNPVFTAVGSSNIEHDGSERYSARARDTVRERAAPVQRDPKTPIQQTQRCLGF